MTEKKTNWPLVQDKEERGLEKRGVAQKSRSGHHALEKQIS